MPRGKRIFPDAFFQYFASGSEYVEAAPRFLPNLQKQIIPKLSQQDFCQKVSDIQNRIIKGDVYQVNLSTAFTFDSRNIDPLALYQKLREANPSPFMGVIKQPDFNLISGSPERLFSLKDQEISMRPIAGTRKRGINFGHEQELINELKTCPKEQAEHAMLVDLCRNDLNQICEPGSVFVSEERSLEFYSHVMHLVSEVRGKTSKNLREIFASVFPGGTITGAPKQSVMQTIAELEPCPRGPYTGSFGYVSGVGCDFNILIRSLATSNYFGQFSAGAGIVINSIPRHEWKETLRKGQIFFDVLSSSGLTTPSSSGLTTPSSSGLTRGPPTTIARPQTEDHKRVLFLENRDSFSLNIINLCKILGAQLEVVRAIPKSLKQFSHIIIGPGPGAPNMARDISRLIFYCEKTSTPILGICLGHQAIAQYFGANITKAHKAIHGEQHQVFHHNQNLFAGLEIPSTFARYHSLKINQAPKDFNVDAWCLDDTIMAISHKCKPIFGVQFHPESHLSKGGDILVKNFLDLK